LIETTGLPRAGFRQLILHARLDPYHAQELHRVIDTLPLDPEHEQLMGTVGLLAMEALTSAGLDAVADRRAAALAAAH